MYFRACFFLFCVIYYSCPKEFKNAIKNEKWQIFSGMSHIHGQQHQNAIQCHTFLGNLTTNPFCCILMTSLRHHFQLRQIPLWLLSTCKDPLQWNGIVTRLQHHQHSMVLGCCWSHLTVVCKDRTLLWWIQMHWHAMTLQSI